MLAYTYTEKGKFDSLKSPVLSCSTNATPSSG